MPWISIAAALASAAPTRAQTWAVAPSTSVALPTTADIFTCTCPIPPAACTSTGPTIALPGFLGNDFAWVSDALCIGGLTSSCGCRARGNALVRLDGVGSGLVTIRWDAVAWANHDCRQTSHVGSCVCPSAYVTGASAAILMTIDLTVAGLPPGTPVTVDYRWRQLSANMYMPEAADDTSSISGGALAVAGTPVFGGTFDLVDAKGVLSGPGTGSFGTTSGTTVSIGSTVSLDVLILPPPRGSPAPCLEYDSESVAWGGEIALSLVGPPPPFPDECEGIPTLQFSLDLASSSELSDPGADLNDRFDPGDLYLAGGPALPLGGLDGAGDDVTIFTGLDPAPDAPDGPPAASAAPVCSGAPPPLVTPLYFDLDASDALDASLAGLIPPGPLPAPLARFPSTCVHDARFLLLSYDDDGGGHYAATSPLSFLCEVPTLSPSPSGSIHGSAILRDEVVGALLVPTLGGFAAALYPFASESALHTSLAPNPPPAAFASSTPDDDDVDALEIGDGTCPVRLFSFDHEADESVLFGVPGPDPGGIYEVTPGGPVQVVDDVIHLGISDDTDVDAFEFVFAPEAGGTGDVFCLLFSVADDDPLTPLDESGGLDPAMIYASYLTGVSFPFLAAPLPDDVDAITAWCSPLLRPRPKKILPAPTPAGTVTRTRPF